MVVLHRPPQSFENCKKKFTVQKYTSPNFQNSIFLKNFHLLTTFLKLLLSTFLHLKTGLKLVGREFIGEVVLFALSFGDKEAKILCSIDFDLKKKILKKKKKVPQSYIIKTKMGLKYLLTLQRVVVLTFRYR